MKIPILLGLIVACGVPVVAPEAVGGICENCVGYVRARPVLVRERVLVEKVRYRRAYEAAACDHPIVEAVAESCDHAFASACDDGMSRRQERREARRERRAERRAARGGDCDLVEHRGAVYYYSQPHATQLPADTGPGNGSVDAPPPVINPLR